MDFPRYVFTSPGNLSAGWGRTYGEEIVNDAAEYDAAIKAGFYGTLPEALEAAKNPKKAEEAKSEEPAKDKTAEPDLVAKAEALGIKVDKRWGPTGSPKRSRNPRRRSHGMRRKR